VRERRNIEANLRAIDILSQRRYRSVLEQELDICACLGGKKRELVKKKRKKGARERKRDKVREKERQSAHLSSRRTSRPAEEQRDLRARSASRATLLL
jgi:hypothetical protein